MIAFDSPLRRLPPGLDRRQTLILDGIRHAAEIAGLADVRLRQTLTAIANNNAAPSPETAAEITTAYLDAWAVVDSIDRLRTLVPLLPELPGKKGVATLASLLGPSWQKI